MRDQAVREIRNRVTILERPLERCLFLPHRRNDIFGACAETMWVLAGRDDVGWLQHYLPRAKDFSDDGTVWRAAYGPRLRNWNGVDQIDQTRKLLLGELATRRAVMVLFDPDRDFVSSKDIPCNNWLNWLVRDGQLHLTVGVRSNDIVWGFSGVNSFTWSVMQQMMSHWIGVPVGDVTYIATSFHIYERHYPMAKKAISSFRGVTCYDFGLATPPFTTSWKDFGDKLRRWFELEHQTRSKPEDRIEPAELDDPFLFAALELIRIRNGLRIGWGGERLKVELAELPDCDLTAAAYEHIGRTYPEILRAAVQPLIASFLSADTEDTFRNPDGLASRVKSLHRSKNAAYGNAWKKRGELTSVLANIARKVDRLEVFGANRVESADEPIFDTVIDLFVYVTKYRLFLLEQAPELIESYALPKPLGSVSDSVENFEALVDYALAENISEPSSQEGIAAILSVFEKLHAIASHPEAEVRTKLDYAMRLSRCCAVLLATLDGPLMGLF